MGAAPLFSVVVTTYNRPRLLAEALESVRRQTVDDFECLVVNDGQQDVDLPDDHRFTLIDKREGAGMATAANTAIREARGKYLTVLDDDDAYTPRRLELGLQGIADFPVTICWRANYDTGVAGRNRLLEGWVHDVIVDRAPPLLGQMTIERSKMLFLDERLMHSADVEWWLRTTKVLPITTVPDVGLLFRRHPGRGSADMRYRYRERMRLYSIKKDYFDSHRAAAVRFHKRTGIFAREAGLRREARIHLWKAARYSPRPAILYHLGRALVARRTETERT